MVLRDDIDGDAGPICCHDNHWNFGTAITHNLMFPCSDSPTEKTKSEKKDLGCISTHVISWVHTCSAHSTIQLHMHIIDHIIIIICVYIYRII